MAAGAIVARILTQYSDKGSKAAQKDIQKLGRNIDAFGKKATKAFGLAAAATVALSVKIGTDAVKAAIEDSKSQLTLSNALKVTTGATDQAIAAVEDYISKQQMLTNVQDTELRSSLQSLVIATGDVTEAQRLQNIALDISAATGKSLSAVTLAMVRAQQGNTTSLKKLSPELSGLIKKTTKAEDIFSLLGATYEGSAKKLAKQDPIKNMQLAFGEIAEQIGFALLPAVTQFTNYMTTDLIPTFSEFVRLNDAKITKNVIGLAKAIESLAKNGAGIAKFLVEYRTLISFIVGTLVTIISLAKTILLLSTALAILQKVGIVKMNVDLTRGSLGAMKQMGGLTKTYAFIIQNYRKVAAGIGVITAAFRAQGIAAGIAAIATAFATGGASVLAAGSALLAYAPVLTFIGVTAFVVKKHIDSLSKSQDVNTRATEHAARAAEAASASNKKQAETAAALAAERKKAAAAQAIIDAKAAAAAKKKADIEAKTAAVKKRIEKMTGIKITSADESELIQLTAVELLQKKQKDADESLKDRIKLRKEEVALLEMSTKQAGMYVDFVAKLRDDGKISSADLEILKDTWNLSNANAEKYKDIILKIQKDGKISDADIQSLATQWGMSNKGVLDYLNAIKIPATYNGTLFTSAETAFTKWDKANKKLEDYLANLKKDTGVTPPPTPTPTINPPLPSVVQDLIDREMAIDKPFMPGDLGYLGIPKSSTPSPMTSSLYGGGIDYSKIFRSSTFDNGMDLMSGAMSNSNGTQNIYVNIGGSVTSEQDLVQTIRQGLLQGQSSGYGLLLQEI